MTAAGRIVPAATVVPLRDGPGGVEVLLLRRSSRGSFGGMWVFPGGQVDDVDTPGEPGMAEPGSSTEISAARRAAVREAYEEASLELDELELVALSFWLPPAEAPRQFATWFFLAPAGGEIVVDRGEIQEHRWMRPVEAFAARDRGEIELAPPTFTSLWWVGLRPDVASALADAASKEPDRFETRVGLGDDRRLAACLWAGDAGYSDGDIDRPGPRRRLWVDPAGWRIEIDDWPPAPAT